MEMCMKQRCVNEFLLVEKMAPTDIQCHLLNAYGDQTVDVSTVKAVGGVFQQWQQCERQVAFQMLMYNCHTTKWSVSLSAHLHEWKDYEQGTV